MKRLILTIHAKDRINKYGFSCSGVRKAWKKAVRIDLRESFLKKKRKKYRFRQDRVDYYKSDDIVFTVKKQKNYFVCLTVAPRELYDEI
jgi:hypothetical protein